MLIYTVSNDCNVSWSWYFFEYYMANIINQLIREIGGMLKDSDFYFTLSIKHFVIM